MNFQSSMLDLLGFILNIVDRLFPDLLPRMGKEFLFLPSYFVARQRILEDGLRSGLARASVIKHAQGYGVKFIVNIGGYTPKFNLLGFFLPDIIKILTFCSVATLFICTLQSIRILIRKIRLGEKPFYVRTLLT